jgi:hypothetical protein
MWLSAGLVCLFQVREFLFFLKSKNLISISDILHFDAFTDMNRLQDEDLFVVGEDNDALE